MIPTIASLSKRLDALLPADIEITRVNLPRTRSNYWYIVRREELSKWKELSPAQVTVKYIDPILKQIAVVLDKLSPCEVGTLPAKGTPKVCSWLSQDGKVPIRLIITHDEDSDEIVILVDILAKSLDN